MNDENLTIEEVYAHENEVYAHENEVYAHENIDLERGDKLIDDDDHARMLIE